MALKAPPVSSAIRPAVSRTETSSKDGRSSRPSRFRTDSAEFSALQAEDAFEPVYLGDAEHHQSPGRVGPLQPEVDSSLGAQGRATPPETPESSLKLETRQETEAEGASNDVDEATSLHDQAVEVTLATP